MDRERYDHKKKINDKATIYKAEFCAIKESIKSWRTNRMNNEMVVCTDSKVVY